MPRILILEDALLSRRILNRTLQSGGYEVIEATNGAEGLEILKTQPVDCILLDLLMPTMGGLEVLTILKQRGSNIPVIVITADIQETTRQQCLNLGAVAVLHKLVDPQQLLLTLHMVMQSSAHPSS